MKRAVPLDAGLCIALAVATLVVYVRVAGYDFIEYDDPVYVSENPMVARGLTLDGVRWAFTTGQAGNWHPLTWVSHMLDCQLFGMRPGAHHLINMALHVANTLLLFGVLRRMTGARWQSACVAALFALHPLHVESVAWIAERKDVLSTLLWLLVLWAYAGYCAQPSPRRYLLVVLGFALGLLAKPMLVTLPFVLLLLDVWPLGRARSAWATEPATKTVRRARNARRAARERQQSPPVVSLLLEKVPLLVLAVISSFVTLQMQRRAGAVAEIGALPFGVRAANAVVSYAAYLGKLLWPRDLAILYPYQIPVPVWEVSVAALVLLAISLLVVRTAATRPFMAVGWGWYLGTLLPVIGLVQVGNQSCADRYTYVPLIGIFIMIAWGVPELLARWPRRRAALATAAGVVLVLCAAVTWRQVGHWRDGATVLEHAIAVTNRNFIAHNNLGVIYYERGQLDAALQQYTAALQIKPDYAEAHGNVGLVLAVSGHPAEAAEHYVAALRLNPYQAGTHNNLGLVLVDLDRRTEAIAHYRSALKLNPSYPEAHANLGAALLDEGQVDEAVMQLGTALQLQPRSARAHTDLGRARLAQGKIAEAIEHFRAALRMQPNDARARAYLDRALAAPPSAAGSSKSSD